MINLAPILTSKESPHAKVVALHFAAAIEPGPQVTTLLPSTVCATLNIPRDLYERAHREAVKAGWIVGTSCDRVSVPWASAARVALGLPGAPPESKKRSVPPGVTATIGGAT